MDEKILYCGEVKKVLKRGKVGFIRTVSGLDVFFARRSLAPEVEMLAEGDFVTLHIVKEPDEETGELRLVARDVKL